MFIKCKHYGSLPYISFLLYNSQEDFDEFSDVDELYSSLPLDKVESLEDLVTVGPPGLAKVTDLYSNKFVNLYR